MGANFTNNEEAGRFEYFSGGAISKLEYSKIGGVFYLNHAEVPEGLEGEGLGSELMENTLKYIEENNYKIVANCAFAKAYLKNKPDWDKLVK
jgi:uncharacterized protein